MVSYTTNRIPAQGGGGPEVDDGQTSRGGIPLSPDGSVERQGEGETQPQGVTAGETAPFSDWQDISTAPKDGTSVLLYSAKTKARYNPVVAKWVVKWWAWQSQPGAWTVYPTHWIPLPAPPETKR